MNISSHDKLCFLVKLTNITNEVKNKYNITYVNILFIY